MILKEKTAFYKVCFDSMQVGIMVFNEERKIVLSNLPISEIFGYKKKKLHGKNIQELFADKQLFKEFIHNSENDKYKIPIEAIGIKKDSSNLICEISFGKMQYEGKNYFKALITDITLRKQKEDEINHLNVQLEEVVKNRNQELELVVEQLKQSLNKEKELNHLKTNFIALASHEFKTPLSAILTSTELMSKYADKHDATKKNEHLQKVKVMVGRLNGMLDDFLTLENIEAGKINSKFSSFKLSTLIEDILTNTKPFLKTGQELVFEVESDDVIYHDSKIISLIVTNLVYNAIKYSSENKNIKVRIKTNPKNIYLSVEDEGIGIPVNEQNLIFKRFFRAKNAQYYPGTGIGLNIVKGYVSSFKGSISFKSIENRGTIFNVQLPKLVKNDEKSTTNRR